MSGFYITSNKDLQPLIDLCYEEKIVALDTEFTRQTTYYPILSLIQIAINDKIFIVDCLTGVDISPFYEIMADKKIKKILHSSSQDLQIFHQQSNKIPQNIIDLQVMANFCGIGFNIGYSGLAEKLFGIKIDKKLQRSDWQKRPLHKAQIEYAKTDVLYLEKIYHELCKILQQKKREKWFDEEMKSFCQKSLQKEDESLFKSFSSQSKFHYKTQNQIEKIRDLILWREKMAQKINVPRKHFLDDKTVEDIVMIEKFDIDIEEYMIDEIKNIVAKNHIIIENKIHREVRIIMTEEQKANYEKAKKMIAKIAHQEGLKEQFLITSATLKNIILGNKKIDDLIYGWRYYLFGQKLQKLLNS